MWQQKVAQALARRRAEELARKRAEAEARARQAQQQPTPPKSSSPLAKWVKMGLFIIALGGVGLAGGSVQVVESPMSVATEMVNNVLNPPNNSQELEFCGPVAMFCPFGNGGVGGGSSSGGGSLVEILLWAFLTLLTADASTDTQVLPNPQIGPMPRNFDDEYSDEIPLDRILRIPWADFLNPEQNEPDEPEIIYIYRVMSQKEFDNLHKNGVFSTDAINALECKWFADRYEDVLKWEEAFFPLGDGRIVEATIRKEDADTWYFVPFLDGIGPARCATELQLMSILSWRTIK